MWWVHLPEGYALDVGVRGVQLALALSQLTRTEIHLARPDALWRRLLSAREQALLAEHVPSLEQKEAGLADLMASVATLLAQGDDASIEVPEATTSIMCRPSYAVAPCDTPHTWLLLTHVDVTRPILHLDQYERCFAFAPMGEEQLPLGVEALPVAVDGEVFKPPTAAATEETPRVLLIGQGDKAADCTMAQHLLDAGAPAVTLFDPYLVRPVGLPPHVRHIGTSGPEARAATFGRCHTVVVADTAWQCDNHFLWEAVACGATPLSACIASITTWTPQALRDALTAYHTGAPQRLCVPVVAWPEVAARLLRTIVPAALPRVTRPLASGALPTLLACHGGNRSRLTKHRHLGISVATQLILEGLQLAAPGRFGMQWLDYQGPDSARGRFYLYPQGEVQGRSSTELDYVALPQRLSDGSIDAMCSCDPVADDMLGARQLWATKAMPVVSMLHSIHGHGLAFHWMLQMLQFEMFAFDAVISPSRCGATAFRETYASAAEWLTARMRRAPTPDIRIDVIPYGIDRAPYSGLHQAACRHTLGLPQEEVLLLALGRFSKREKADLLPLLLALHALRKAGHGVSLLLAGGAASPPYIQQLRDTVVALGLRDAVRFFDGATTVDKALLLGAADVFVSISDNIQETYGLAIIEAMAARLPVVASAWNGAKEIVRPGETGFLVPTVWQMPDYQVDQIARLGTGVMGYGNRDLHESVVVDIPCLTAHLTTLVTQPELRARMGQRGFEVCVQDFDLATQGRRMAELMVTLIDQASKHPWHPDRQRGPFMSETARRFANYPSAPLDDTQRLELAPVGADIVTRMAVLRSAMEAGCPEEVGLAQRVVALAAGKPGMTLGELSVALSSATLSTSQARLRVVRCWKYGLLQRFAGTCS